MDLRNRTGLYGAYFLGMAGIGFTLPFLPLYLRQQGMSDREIALLSTLAALTALIQFPVALWSDRVGRRQPFLVGALALLAGATALLCVLEHGLVLAVLVIVFAENGPCRATVESLTGAIAAHLARPDEVGRELGALRFFRPAAIILVALAGGEIATRHGIASVLLPLTVLQGLAAAAALLIREGPAIPASETPAGEAPAARWWRDSAIWRFAAAMVLFHVANAPGGVYLGLFLKNDLGAPDRALSQAFAVSMVAWMLVVRPAGRLSDRVGRKPVLLAGWAVMSVRLGLLAVAQDWTVVLAIQLLDGLAQGLFAVAAAAWVADRLADPRRAGEAQALVGTCLVFGSALGPALSALAVDATGYRGVFGLLAAVGVGATALLLWVPEAARDQALNPSNVQPVTGAAAGR